MKKENFSHPIGAHWKKGCVLSSNRGTLEKRVCSFIQSGYTGKKGVFSHPIGAHWKKGCSLIQSGHTECILTLSCARYSLTKCKSHVDPPTQVHPIPKTMLRAVFSGTKVNCRERWSFIPRVSGKVSKTTFFGRAILDCSSQTSLFKDKNPGKKCVTIFKLLPRLKMSLNITVPMKKYEKRPSSCRVRGTSMPNMRHHAFKKTPNHPSSV